MEDLEGIIDFNAVFTFDTKGFYECIEEELRNFCNNASEEYIQETSQYIFEVLKYQIALNDAIFWVNNGKYMEYDNFSRKKKYEIAEAVIEDCFLTEPWKMLIGSQLKKEKVKKFYEDQFEKGYGGNTYGFTEFMMEYFHSEITYNILDFIDSQEIRELNQNTEFTPIEQAYVIYHSKKTTVEQKMKAWRELLDSYFIDEFEWTSFGKRRFGEKNNSWLLENTLIAYKNALSQRNVVDNVIFEANYYKCDSAEQKDNEPVAFSNYNDAFAYIEREKKKYPDNEEMKNCLTKAEIHLKYLEPHVSEEIIYYFDNELRMISILPKENFWMNDWYGIDELEVL